MSKEEVAVPSVGESVSQGILTAWLKREGEAVEEGEDLFELETDKATVAVPSPASGVLHIQSAEGQEVSVGQVVGTLDTGAAAGAAGEPEGARREEGARRDAAGPEAREAAPRPPAPEAPALSPAVRRIVREEGLSPEEIRGTGRGGRITQEDALRAARERAAPSAGEAPGGEGQPETRGEEPGQAESREPMSRLRQTIAARLVQASTQAALLTTFNEIDMSRVAALRRDHREQFEQRHGVRLGFMSFFVKASCQALLRFPVVNARIDGSDIVYSRVYNIGVAVSTDRGLVVPVIRGADRMSFAEIERKVLELAERARQRRISPDELAGGTFTITNGGVFGSLLSTPLPNFPQSAVLGMHAIQKRPVAVDDQVVIRPMMYVALTYDHRLIDGREAVSFLAAVKELVEKPERLLLQV